MTKWYRPTTLAEALEVRGAHAAVPLAGATDLYVRHRRGAGLLPAIDEPIVTIGHLEELRELTVSSGHLRIGAAARYGDLVADKRVPEVLRASLRELAAPALRNAGTLGGNICNASPAADAVCPLYSLDAVCELSSSTGMRTLPVADFARGPGKTDLGDDELLTAIVIPNAVDRLNDAWFYRKVGTRRANALSKLAIAATAQIDGSGDVIEVRDVAIALGAVGPTVLRSKNIEAKLRGRKEAITAATTEVLDAYEGFVTPIDDQRSTRDYRREVAVNLVRQFIEQTLLGAHRP